MFIRAIRKNALLVVTLLLFIALLPLSASVDFYQNDDWVYYKNVESFSKSRFVLEPVTAPIFYSQGLLALPFFEVFGSRSLPILTAAVSALNFYIFARIVIDRFGRRHIEGLLIGLLFFLNPINVYSFWGFMTESYFLFFFLLCIYFGLMYERSENARHFVTLVICTVLAFFVRQVAFVIPFGFGIYFLLKRKFKPCLIQLCVLVVLIFYYYLLFPRTAEMFEKGLELKHLLEYKYLYALVYGILVYVAALLAPLIILNLPFEQNRLSMKRFLIFIICTLVLYILLNKFFEGRQLAWGEFPYLDNTFERKGFFPRNIGGTKYHFYGIYDLYKYWEISAKVLAAVLVSILAIKWKKIFSPVLVMAVMYILVLSVAQKTYDRYLTVLFPLMILVLVKNTPKFSPAASALLLFFNFFLFFMSYQFSTEFVLVNRYIWDKAEQLSLQNDLPKSQIQATNAWKLTYSDHNKDYFYDFSYDSPKINETYAAEYELIETKVIDFPLNFFINSRIYLYHRL